MVNRVSASAMVMGLVGIDTETITSVLTLENVLFAIFVGSTCWLFFLLLLLQVVPIAFLIFPKSLPNNQ